MEKYPESFTKFFLQFKMTSAMRKIYEFSKLAEEVIEKDLPGDIAEFGVFGGGSALYFYSLFSKKKREKRMHLFDTFSGMPDQLAINQLERSWKGKYKVKLEEVQRNFEGKDVVFYQGLFSETSVEAEDCKFCFVYVDADYYHSIKQSLEFFYPRLVPSGVMCFDDYNFEGVRKAFQEFMPDIKEKLLTFEENRDIAALRKE